MNKQKLFAALPVLAALCVFSSCASTPAEPGTPEAGAVPGESQLLDDSSKVSATDVPDAGAFADLDSAKKKEESSAATPAADGDTYYSSLGGETMRRVAYTLYSSNAASKQLLAKNPGLQGVAKLTADQKVFFDMDTARPEPRYLTKDLLSRYAEPLAERLNSQASAKGLQKTEVTVNKGESLQDVSQRLYGTHRYWTEIYLVNRDKIKNYDRVPAGLTLSVVDRPSSAGVAKAEARVAAVARTEEVKEAPAAPVKAEPIPLPAVAPSSGAVLPPPPIQATTHEAVVAPTPIDPMPETTPAAAEKAAPVPEMAPPPPPPPIKPVAIQELPRSIPAASAHMDSGESSNSSLRRILYFVLVLAIGGAAFYFTRTPKRPTVDMLDATADASRPKLTPAPKDSHHSQIG